MLDASSSLRDEGFIKEKEFIKNVVDRVWTADGFRAGVVEYSEQAVIRVLLDDFFRKENFQNAVDQLPYDKRGMTRIDLGLKEVQKSFTVRNGARGTSKKVG